MKAKAVSVQKIIQTLKRTYPESKISLNFKDPLELLVATILSAQCTDERVNRVTATLFKKCRKPEDYANASLEELEGDIRSTGFFRNKAKNIKNCCRDLIKNHCALVPSTMEELIKLPGVGRKTANCVLGSAFGQPAIAVDTHVKRLVERLGISEKKDPDKIEFDLMKLVPRKDWTLFSFLLISHGRSLCVARGPKCEKCPLLSWCPYGASRA
jgi:endonuclease-3